MPSTNAGAVVRLILAVLIGTLVAVAGIPDDFQAHSFDLGHQSSGDGHLAGSSHGSSEGNLIEECHPGLDCLTVGAFLLSPSLASPHRNAGTAFRLSSLVSEGWAPLSDKPPPRSSS